MPQYYPVVVQAGRNLAGDSLGFHAYSLRIDNCTNQWYLEETSLAYIPPYSLGVCLRLYGTGVAILLASAPIGQPQLAPVVGEQLVGTYSDQLRTEVAPSPIRQFTLVQSVSDLTQGAMPATPPVGITRLWAAPNGDLHYLLSSGVDATLLSSTNYAAYVGGSPVGGDSSGTVSNMVNVKASGNFPVGGNVTATGAIGAGAIASTAIAGDMTSARDATHGIVWLGSNGAHYVNYDGTNYNLPSGGLTVNGTSLTVVPQNGGIITAGWGTSAGWLGANGFGLASGGYAIGIPNVTNAGGAGIAYQWNLYSCVDHAELLGLNIEPISDPIGKLLAIDPVYYNHTQIELDSDEPMRDERGEIVSTPTYGMSAKQVAKVLPELVGPNPDDPQTLDYARMVVVLWAVCQQQETRLQALEAA